ncbi:hypothetical protein [Amycolatopsis benzoatilytica]|uniref:hypothetical protein n=1 Tax=Amycolatopsis benzoatilytica TaxID=346045 RepID=UPI000370318D|nr:hypothetical protein [Amycolatopsis benzoatilytica]
MPEDRDEPVLTCAGSDAEFTAAGMMRSARKDTVHRLVVRTQAVRSGGPLADQSGGVRPSLLGPPVATVALLDELGGDPFPHRVLGPELV